MTWAELAEKISKLTEEQKRQDVAFIGNHGIEYDVTRVMLIPDEDDNKEIPFLN